MAVLALIPKIESVQGTACPKLEHQDSNLDCPDPKSGGLPLPYAPKWNDLSTHEPHHCLALLLVQVLPAGSYPVHLYALLRSNSN